MKEIRKKFLSLLAVCLGATLGAFAQKGYNDMEQLTINENVSSIITASEPIRLVDISTDSIAGDKPLENVIRLKPKTGNHKDGEVMGVVTIITERYRVQHALIYTSKLEEAVTDKEVELVERNAFHNPDVSMSTVDMVSYAMKVWNSPARYRSTFTTQNKMTMRLNNIYVVGEYFFIDFSVDNKTNLPFDIDELRVKLQDKKQQKATNVQTMNNIYVVGEYFFIDFSVDNKTNLPFDIDELRVKLQDKKQQKATNVQTIELKPALVLDRSVRFKKGYRNIIVLKKMTFPNDKVLSIELSEKQISGRTISMNLDYEDVLAADAFDTLLLREQ